MMSQALKATFSGFAKEQQRLGIPKGKTWSPMNDLSTHRVVSPSQAAQNSLSAISPAGFGSFSWKNVDKSSPLNREAAVPFTRGW